MKIGLISRRLRGCLYGLAAILTMGCADDELPGGADVALKEGEIALQWVAANMGTHVSRGTDTKTGEERQINNVHIFLFTEKGNYLKPSNDGRDVFQGYRRLDNGGTNWILQTDLFADQDSASRATVYVLANMPVGYFADTDNDGRPDDVATMADLEAMAIELPTFTTDIPESGLPMVLKQAGVDLSNTADTKIVMLQLRSMMSRIDLNFTMDPLQGTVGNLPSLEFRAMRVGNFPTGGKVVSQLVEEDGTTSTGTTKTDEEAYGLTDFEVTDSPILNQVLREGSGQNVTFYMFEHAREANPENVLPGGNYPENIADTARQRYKNYLAKDDAAYIEFEGNYTSQNGFRYRISYRLYVGANPVNDFTIKPNCQYKNNITITGITVNNYGDEALLDTRVTIHEDTPAFIEILRERQFDAHFNVTPMDIYLNEEGAQVTVAILNENGEPAQKGEMEWIRMEPYYHAPRGKCDYKENAGKYAATKAGDGKRKYFTTNLMSSLKNDYNLSYTVTHPEERIYFYIDENVPTEEQAAAGLDVPSRNATIRITYLNANGEETSQEATFVQAGMRSVLFDKYSQGTYDYGRRAYYFYIEEYEEYLAHYDGKNEYTDTYEGLEWGLRGVSSGLENNNGFYEYLSWGWYNTAKIMREYRNHSSWRGHEMTLNEKPSGAAEYCYNKNKREDDNGNLSYDNVNWFLPTISELEYALERYYGIFDVFQDKWYWSSNPGAYGSFYYDWQGNPVYSGGTAGESVDHARATRIKHDPNNESGEAENGYVHYRSDPDWRYTPDDVPLEGTEGVGGYAEREEKFRIRAAYIKVKPTDVRPWRE